MENIKEIVEKCKKKRIRQRNKNEERLKKKDEVGR